MSVPVFWLTRQPMEFQSYGPWDSGLLEAMFEGELWPHPWMFEHHHNVTQIEKGKQGIVVLPARHHAKDGDIDWLNAELRKLDAAILILVGDEEAIFPWREIRQENCRFWVMIPDPRAHFDMIPWAFFFGDGWKHDTPQMLAGPQPIRDLNWSFAGQVTNTRRKIAVGGLQIAGKRTPGTLIETEGFTQGLPRPEYLDLLKRTRVAPCPGGPQTPDTFRTYEALEAGCFPIVDARSVVGGEGYWEMVYGTVPFPVVDDWSTIGGHIHSALKGWPASANRASAWWIAQKRGMVERLSSDLVKMGCEPDWPDAYDQQITVLVTCSPILSHPSTEILEQTLESVWASFGRDSIAVVAFDGVRPEQEYLRQAYEEHIQEVCWRAQNGGWNGVHPVIAPQHLHQAKLTQLALESVTTPLILFMEHDTPLTADPIDWDAILDLMAHGHLDVLRFHHESQILPDHEHLMLDHETRMMLDVPLRRTRQWSQRPHVATAAYYRKMLNSDWFQRPHNGFIEDTWHGVVQSYGDDTANRVAIYCPPGVTIGRSFHTDGRAGNPKFDDRKMA